jgi:hypothetical protein
VFSNPAIRGVQLIANWGSLEGKQGDFNWAPMDQVFCQADAAHKFVVLTLVPGFDTPAWVLNGENMCVVQASPYTCDTWAEFGREYGAGSGKLGDLPMPWNSTYQSDWSGFLGAVA